MRPISSRDLWIEPKKGSSSLCLTRNRKPLLGGFLLAEFLVYCAQSTKHRRGRDEFDCVC